MGNIYISIRCIFRVMVVIIINSDNIIPSKHSRDDIRWDR